MNSLANCPRSVSYGRHEFVWRGPDCMHVGANGERSVIQVYFCKWCLYVERSAEPERWDAVPVV